MATSLRDVIRETINTHLDAGYLVLGQCLTAVGWVANTLPQRSKDMVELPCSDVAGAGFAVGVALAGRRPIYVIRYQGFNWFNAALIVNYAAKSKALWGRPCPLLIRSIAMEGGIGPVAGSSHHSLYYRMPGVKILSPMTPLEYRAAYKEFMDGDDVVYLSEHRKAYDNEHELPALRPKCPEVVLFPISVTRFAAVQAARQLAELDSSRQIAVHHIATLKPFTPTLEMLLDLRTAGAGIVLDDDYPDGVAKCIAHDLIQASGVPDVAVMGLENRTAGFSAQVDNLPPTPEQILQFIESMI